MRLTPALLLLVLAAAACGRSRSESTPALDDSAEAGAAPISLDAPGLREPVLPATPAALPDEELPCAQPQPPDPQLVEKCVLLDACGSLWQYYGGSTIYRATFVTTISQCIELAYPRSGLMSACEQQATTCQALQSCWGLGDYDGACPLEVAQGNFCDGSKLVECGRTRPAIFLDCAKLGATCAEYDVGDQRQIDCIVDSACGSVDDSVYHCDGSKRVLCQAGLPRGEDCAARKADCVDDGQGAECVARGNCTPELARCNADGGASLCADDDHLEHRLDCTLNGLECFAWPEVDPGVECRVPGCTREQRQQCLERCDGPIAQLCVGGARLSVDCRDYGLNYCVLVQNDYGLGPAALCRTQSTYEILPLAPGADDPNAH